MIKFTIPGDPVPYLRMTQGQVKLLRMPRKILNTKQLKVVEKIQRYLDYKKLVKISSVGLQFNRSPDFKHKLYMDVMIYFRNGRHADPENVRKGIQDALFESDKHVCGCYDHQYDADNPRCEVVIR